MPSVIQLNYSVTPGNVPTTGDITVAGGVSINPVDKKLYTRDDSNNIVYIGVQDGTSDGTTLVWDTTTGHWVETSLIQVSDAGLITINALNGLKVTNLATSDPLEAGELWNDSGTLKVSAG